MGQFFDRRAETYNEHMQETVASFDQFYASIAAPLPRTDRPLQILDLGCGTGLELAHIWRRVPNAQIVGIDLSRGMLDELEAAYAQQRGQLRLCQESYLAMEMGSHRYDCIIAVMTLHHLKPDVKTGLYARIHHALIPQGIYVEGDYVVSPEKEAALLERHRRLSGRLSGRLTGRLTETDRGSHHIDIPFSDATQRRLLREAGFERVERIFQQGEATVYAAYPGA